MISILTLKAHSEQWSMDQVFVSACDVRRFSLRNINQMKSPSACFVDSLRESFRIYSLSNMHTYKLCSNRVLYSCSNRRTHTNGKNENTRGSQHSQHKLNAHTRIAVNGERRTVYGHQHHSSCVVAVYSYQWRQRIHSIQLFTNICAERLLVKCA